MDVSEPIFIHASNSLTNDPPVRRKTDVEHLLEIYETEAKRVKYRQEWELEQEKQKEWQRTCSTSAAT